MKQILLLTILFLVVTPANAVTKDIFITTPGSLTSLLTEEEKTTITDLKLSGNINNDDFLCLKKEITLLENLDLKDTEIKGWDNQTTNEIPERAFIFANSNWESKTSLKRIVFPRNLKSIGAGAFEGCTGLSDTLSFPTSLITIGHQAFYGCTNIIGSLIIPDSVETIGRYAFCQCTNLNGTISIGTAVKNIGGGAFSYCSSIIGGLKIPNSVTSIGSGAFSGCTNLNGNLIMGDSVETIGSYAFFDCDNLTGELTIPPLVQSIGEYAFGSCNLSGTLTIGNSVKTIGDYAFWNCNTIQKIIIGDSVIQIGKEALHQGLNLHIDEYIVSNVNKSYSSSNGVLFNNEKTNLIAYPREKEGIYSIPNTVTTIEELAFAGCRGLEGNLTIPNTVTTIEDKAFMSFKMDGSISIAASVTKIADKAFFGINGVTDYIIDNDNLNYTSGSGVFFNKLKTNLIQYPSGKTGGYTIPNTVETINEYAFFRCVGITNIYIPNTIDSISNFAFSECYYLEKITTDRISPLNLQSRTFGHVPKNSCILEVPQGSKEAYQNASVWNEFTQIIETIPTSMNNKIETRSIYKRDNNIIIEGVQVGTRINIYSVSGTLIESMYSTGKTCIIPIKEKGIYIVTSENNSEGIKICL